MRSIASSFSLHLAGNSRLAYSLAACFFGLLFVAPMLAQETREKIDVDDVSRNYILRLPKGYNQLQHYPVVILFHGRNQDADDMARLTLFNQLADKEGIITVYPNAAHGEWNTGVRPEQVSQIMPRRGGGGRRGGWGGGGGGYPGGGGGYPGGGMGGGGMGRGRRGGMGGPAPVQYHGVVRWVSAKPIQEVLKSPVPEGLANAYVVGVSGFPIITGDRQRGDDGDSGDTGAKGPSQDVLDRIKALTYLEPKGKPPAQPGKVQAGSAGFETNVLLFGFSHELLQLTAEDKEVTFTTQLGRLEIKTKFNLREMRYRKELAL